MVKFALLKDLLWFHMKFVQPIFFYTSITMQLFFVLIFLLCILLPLCSEFTSLFFLIHQYVLLFFFTYLILRLLIFACAYLQKCIILAFINCALHFNIFSLLYFSSIVNKVLCHSFIYKARYVKHCGMRCNQQVQLLLYNFTIITVKVV